jgi:hypothetical protein
MTHQLDDWEGRLAAMMAGRRYKAPRRRTRSAPVPVAAPTNNPEGDLQPFLTDQCPCDQCELRRQCADGQLACERYELFMQGKSPNRWRAVPATPTRERFERYLTGSTD